MTRRTALALFAPSPDSRALLARSITHDEENFNLLRSYVFEIFNLGVRSRRSRFTQTFEVNLVGPGMYFRKLATNDTPLSAEEAALEQTRLRMHLAQATTNDPKAQWRKERELLQIWLETHQFFFKGETQIENRPAWIIESKPPSRTLAPIGYLTNATTRLIIDQESGHWVEATCNFLRPTSFDMQQLLMGRISLPYSPGLVNRDNSPAGSTLRFTLKRLEDGLWVPDLYRIDQPGFFTELRFSNFRKFTAESQLLPAPQ